MARSGTAASGSARSHEPRSLPDSDEEKSIHGTPSTEDETDSWSSRLSARGKKHGFSHALASEKMGDQYLVDFNGPDDSYAFRNLAVLTLLTLASYNPLNWTPRQKAITLIIFSNIALITAFNTAVFEPATAQIAQEFGVSREVATLGTTLNLIGGGTFPLLFAPLSELYGRKWTVVGPTFIAACFAFACGASKDLQSIIITRFFQGGFGAAVTANLGGILGDIYSPQQRGAAMVLYSTCVVAGPLTAPIIGSAIVTSHLGWRWTMFLVGIFQIVFSISAMIFVSETYAPVLLSRKAAELRHATRNWALHSKHEEWNVSIRELARKYLIRPFLLMINPTCFLMSFYASFVYGLIYGSLAAVPYIFENFRGYSPVVASLPFLALLLGCLAGLVVNLGNTKLYVKAMTENDGEAVPEARLYPMMGGSFFLTAGIFILAWTGPTTISWVVPCIGLCCVGTGFFPIFQGSLNYLIDTFLPVAASALATTIFMRCMLAAVFPLFMTPMLQALGVGWGLSLLGFVGVMMIPVPFLFFTFGSRLRAKGRAMPV